MPEALVKFGLKNALLDYCNAMQLSSKVHVGYEQLGDERALGNTADLNIYRIVQELISNAIRHGNPSHIMVQLTKTKTKVLLTVEDDGDGFDKDNALSKEGMGLKSIQQRVTYLKGSMDMDTSIGNGSSINIELYI
jgi:two-component system NarL family sensor kinase